MRRPELCFQRRYELQIRCTAAQLMRVDGARKVRKVQTRGGHVPNGNNRGARGIVAATRQTPKWGASRYRIRHRHAPGEPYHKCNVQTGTQSTVRSLVDSAKTSVALPAALPALALEPLIDLGQPGLAYPGEIRTLASDLRTCWRPSAGIWAAANVLSSSMSLKSEAVFKRLGTKRARNAGSSTEAILSQCETAKSNVIFGWRRAAVLIMSGTIVGSGSPERAKSRACCTNVLSCAAASRL